MPSGANFPDALGTISGGSVAWHWFLVRILTVVPCSWGSVESRRGRRGRHILATFSGLWICRKSTVRIIWCTDSAVPIYLRGYYNSGATIRAALHWGISYSNCCKHTAESSTILIFRCTATGAEQVIKSRGVSLTISSRTEKLLRRMSEN